jgi:hypothetical protein
VIEMNGGTHPAAAIEPGLRLVPVRATRRPLSLIRLALAPGDRPLVAAGDAVAAGAAIAERLRDGRTDTVRLPSQEVASVRPGDWLAPMPASGGSRIGRRARSRSGELLFAASGQWRLATGDRVEVLEAPVAGSVAAVVPGAWIEIAAAGTLIPGAELLGSPAHGRLEILAPASGEIRSAAIDVGLAGRIIVVGARIDAEALLRARATGVAGVVVGSLGARERRDLAASERRQQAALQAPRPFGVLVLGGAIRQPVASPTESLLEALAGGSVALVPEPVGIAAPGVPVDGSALPRVRPDLVRIVAGPMAGREGTWAGLAGPRGVAPGVVLDSALVRIGDAAPVAVPLVALERFA